jgi:hypothetical protein
MILWANNPFNDIPSVCPDHDIIIKSLLCAVTRFTKSLVKAFHGLFEVALALQASSFG